MKNIDKMLKCRAIFLYNIGLICDDFNVLNDERLYVLLDNFLDEYIDISFKRELDGEVIHAFSVFNLLYYFESDNFGNLSIDDKPEWNDVLRKYLSYFAYNDVKNISKIYDEIGYDTIDKINELVKLFYGYIMTMNDMSKERIRN